MTSKETCGPAFPSVEYHADGSPYNNERGMTLRAYAAINLKVPESGIYWLDEMIRKANRDSLAEKAMQALAPVIDGDNWAEITAVQAYRLADAMLAERAK